MQKTGYRISKNLVYVFAVDCALNTFLVSDVCDVCDVCEPLCKILF